MCFDTMSPTLPITAVSASKAMREEQEKKGNNRMTPRGAIVALSYMAFAGQCFRVSVLAFLDG